MTGDTAEKLNASVLMKTALAPRNILLAAVSFLIIGLAFDLIADGTLHLESRWPWHSVSLGLVLGALTYVYFDRKLSRGVSPYLGFTIALMPPIAGYVIFGAA